MTDYHLSLPPAGNYFPIVEMHHIIILSHLKLQCNTFWRLICYMLFYDTLLQLLSSDGHTSIHRTTNNQDAVKATSSLLTRSLVNSSKYDKVVWLWVTTAYLTMPFIFISMSFQYGAKMLTFSVGNFWNCNARAHVEW